MGDESKQPATAAQIRRMVGDVDDAVVSSIERTGASAAEVLQAVQWLRGGGGLEDEAGHEPHGAVKAVYEILQAEEPEETP
jgi:hypothetical protein